MDRENLSGMIKALALLKEQKRATADLLKEINKSVETQEQEIIAAMMDMADSAGIDDVQAFGVTVDGRRYSVGINPYYSIRAADRDEAFSALRGLGLGDLIVERVDDRTLTNALAQVAEANGGELPEEYMALPLSKYEKTTISDRKVAR